MQNQDNSGKIIKSIHPSKIILPIIIGLGFSMFMLYQEYKPDSLDTLKLTWQTLFWLFVSIFFMVVRDLGYIIRIRLLSNKQLTWSKAFSVIMLWEFTSAITPSAIGGTSVAIFFLNKEGIRIGRSTAMVMVTSFLDELFFIISFPIVILFIGRSDIFGFGSDANIVWYKNHFLIFTLTGYGLKFIYTLIITYGLFINPRGLKLILLWIFKFPIIRKWRPNANESGTDLIQTSKEFKKWPFRKWLMVFSTTILSWICRYWIANAIIVSFFGFKYLNIEDHILVFGKQLVMWIMMLVSPTPGGSGFAEYVFKEFLTGIIPIGTGATLAFLWRIVSYYPYLFIGVIIVPRWIRKHFTQH